MDFVIMLQECPQEWSGHTDLCDQYYADLILKTLCCVTGFSIQKFVIKDEILSKDKYKRHYEQVTFEDIVLCLPTKDVEKVVNMLNEQEGYKVVETKIKDPNTDWKTEIERLRKNKD